LIRFLVLSWFLLVSPFLAGCKSSEPEGQWLQYEVEAQTDELLIEVTALSLQKCGFPIGSGVDPGHLRIVTGWHNSLAPFRGEGWREQCEVRYEKKTQRHYSVSIRVKREKNDDLLRPLDLTYAQWVPEPDNTDRARMVLQHIRSLLDTDVEVDLKR